MAKDIKCTCGHSWNKSDSSKKDMYVCHMCGNSNVAKAQVGYKLGKSEDEVRQAVLKKAAEVFAGKKKPYKLPENIEQIEGSGRNVCISGVCGILSDAGFIPNDYYTNTSFAEKASGLGFGSPQTDINILKPGDVFQHLVDANEQGNRYPTHAEIFKGWNDKGEAEFYDYYDFYNWPVSKSSGIRTYDRSELEQRLSRKAKNDQSDTQAQFFSLAGGQNKVTKQFPYNLPENELKDYFEKTHEANTTFSAPAPTIDKNSPLYYSSGEDVRQGTREGLADMFNNKELDKQLKRELKITDQDLQKIKPLIYGVVGQESQFNNPRSTTGGLKYMFENMFNPKGKSLGPGQIKLKSITPSVRESFGITKGSDLQDLKNTYIGLADIISKSANITDKYVSQETHPDLVDKDRFERALYFLNSPGKVRKSDKQNYDKSMKSNSILTNFSEQAMMDAVGRANETKLSMDPGSYPAKVLDRAKELNKTINFEDTSILPEVVVTAKKKKEDGGWLSKFEQGGMVLEQKGDNYGIKPNPNDVQASVGPDFVGLGYDTTGRNYSPAWGGQFQSGGFLEPISYKLPSRYRIPYAEPSSELAMSIGGEGGEPAYLIPSFKGGKELKDPIAEYKKTGEHLGGPFKTWQEADKWEQEIRHPYVEKGKPIPTPLKRWGDMAMGGSLPGAVGFTYARTAGSAPSNGKYAKKTKASAQNGKEMKFYQEGLDFKPNSIAQDGGAIVDPMGQWAHPGEVTIIPATDITMEGVDYPVLGISDTGDQQMMYPGEDYQFDGDYVTEYPMMKQGGWLSKYQGGGGITPEFQALISKSDKLKSPEDKKKFEQVASAAKNKRETVKQDNRTSREKEIAQKQLLDLKMDEARSSSPFTQTLSSFTPTGSNEAAGQIAAENIGQMTPMMGATRLFTTAMDPKNNPYGIGQGNGFLANTFGTLGLIGDAFDVGAVTAPGVKAAGKYLTNPDLGSVSQLNTTGLVPPPLPEPNLSIVPRGNYLESELTKGNKISLNDVDKLGKKEIDWLQSDEYFNRRSAATGESASEIQKDVDEIINRWGNLSVSAANTGKDALGFYGRGKNRIVISDKLNRKEALPILDHEVKHALSQMGGLKGSQGYKNYPTTKVDNWLNRTFGFKNANYYAEPWEQQVRGLRLLDFIEKTQGVPRGTKLSAEDITQFAKNVAPSSTSKEIMELFDKDYDDVVSQLFKMKAADTELKFIPSNIKKLKSPFQYERKGNLRENILDWLNKTYAVPVGVGIGAGTLGSDEEVPKQKDGGWLTKYK